MIIAAQLWIFSAWNEWETQAEASLGELAKAGYAAVEGLYLKAPHTRQTIDAAGIAYGATHLTPPNLEPSEPLLTFLTTMNSRHICSSGPLQWNERTPDDYRKTAQSLNEKGRQLREQGIRLHYHNHEFEFQKIEGGPTTMELLLAEFDPEAVTLCFDAGWAQQAGIDAAEFMREHAAFIEVLHLRDFRGTQSVPLGQGDMDLAAQIALLSSLPNLKYIAVEQDPSPAPLADMITSRRYLRDTFRI